jgi:outer membrane protein assembly factor BamA
MPERRPRYSDEEFLRRGEEIFTRKILPLVATENPRSYVLIDIETEDFEVDDNPISAADRLIVASPTTTGLTPSLAVQQAAAAGPAWVSATGSTTTYSTLDNTRSPTSGVRSQLSQDLAGLGGDVKFLRTTEDVRYYHSLNSDLVGMVRAQGGYVTGWGGQHVPLMNNFFGGPTMVRGFAPNGFGPRDLTPGTTMDNVGGSAYWATTAELQSAIPGIPQEYGLKASAFIARSTYSSRTTPCRAKTRK